MGEAVAILDVARHHDKKMILCRVGNPNVMSWSSPCLVIKFESEQM
jgi:hypothetical protein